MPRFLLAAVLAAAALSSHARAAEIVVSAAASLTNAFRDIGQRFEAAHPGDRVVFNFAASDVLLAQVERGAPADVLATADSDTMDRAERHQRLRAGTRRPFAANRLVVVVPRGAPAVPTLQALQEPRVRRIAVGSPETVPAGRYARDALRQASTWESVQAKLVFAQNVRQVLDYVARGEADAGFVYGTDAALMPDRVTVSATPREARPVRYPIAALAASREPGLAAAFVAFVAGRDGQVVLERYGFLPADAP